MLQQERAVDLVVAAVLGQRPPGDAGVGCEDGRRKLAAEPRQKTTAVCSLAVHDLLVVERGWSYERYQEWLTAALTCELLPVGRA